MSRILATFLAAVLIIPPTQSQSAIINFDDIDTSVPLNVINNIWINSALFNGDHYESLGVIFSTNAGSTLWAVRASLGTSLPNILGSCSYFGFTYNQPVSLLANTQSSPIAWRMAVMKG
ncbi:MAG: hypothetical protein WCL39_03315 [Armatimonadota bacterium]